MSWYDRRAQNTSEKKISNGHLDTRAHLNPSHNTYKHTKYARVS
jgi:hypothetical protein